MNEQKRIVEVATNFVVSILNKNQNIDSLNAIYEIKQGNKEMLLEHLKAIDSIVGNAIEIIGNTDESEVEDVKNQR